MASWLQNQLKAAEELLHAVDRTAKNVSTAQAQVPGGRPGDERPKVQVPGGSNAASSTRPVGSQAPSPSRGTSIKGLRPSSRSSSSAELVADNSRQQRAPAAGGAGGAASQAKPPAARGAAAGAAAPAKLAAAGGEAAVGEVAAPATSYQRKATSIPFAGSGAASPSQASGALAAAAKPATTTAGEQQAAAAPSAPADEPLPAAAPQAAHAAPEAADAAPAMQLAQQAEVSDAPKSSALVEGHAHGLMGAAAAAEPSANFTSEAAPPSAAAVPFEAEAHQESTAGPAAAPASEAQQPADTSVPGGQPQPPAAAASPAVEEVAGGQPSVTSAADADSNDDAGLLRIGQELDEARGLAGAPASQRELRLQKMLERLKQRLEQYKQENQQLEELLAAADAKARGGTGEIERLEDEVARAQAARISAEAALHHALAAKEGEVRSLREQLEAANRKVLAAEEQLQQLREANDTLIAERKVSEGQLIQSLRKEVEGIEQVLEEERAAHAATRKAAAAREHELEGSLQDSASSLSRMQREVEQRTARLAALEERCSALEHEVDTLTHQLRTTEGKLQKQLDLAQQSSSEALQARISELEGALLSERGATAAAEQGRAAADEELVRLRAEVGSLKRQVAEAASQDAGDLQRRLKEVTDLLYLKQTQLERIASEKAAQQLQLERELAQARAEAEQVKRRARTDRAIAAAEDSVVPMDTIGDAYHRLANNNRVGSAVKAGAKLLDATASQVVRILRQYPVGRLVVFTYILGVHLFIYMLIHRLQRRAFISEHRAAAAAADLEDVHDQLAG